MRSIHQCASAIALCVVGLLAASVAGAQACPSFDHGGGPRSAPFEARRHVRPDGFGGEFWGAPAYLSGLQLTEEQSDKIFSVLYAAAPAIHEQHNALRHAHEELAKLRTSAQFDESNARTLADSAAKAESQLLLLHLKAERQIYSLLTADQRTRLDKREQDHGPHDPAGPPAS